MKPEKRLPGDLERAMSVFQVRPDWYEDYWLKPEKSPAPAEIRWRRQKLAIYSIICAAIVAIMATVFWTAQHPQTLAANVKMTSASPRH